jgi:BirA family biotin operon repressor/biotin-[acetyl-CoA-carboxylase] ligase
VRPGASTAGTDRRAAGYDGRSAGELAELLALPRVVLFDEVGSTLDVAHELGEAGAEAGTLVIADAQTAGRGRMRRTWLSEPGAGLWLTFIERPEGDESLGVVALRLALALAPALDRFASRPVQLKWPNDLYVHGRKLAGLLVEARWRGARLDWLAVGIGVNVRAPQSMDAAALMPGVDRITVLREIVPAIRAAVAAPGILTGDELARFGERNLAIGKRAIEPVAGVVVGVGADGALLVDTGRERVACYAGSLILAPDGQSSGDPA